MASISAMPRYAVLEPQQMQTTLSTAQRYLRSSSRTKVMVTECCTLTCSQNVAPGIDAGCGCASMGQHADFDKITAGDGAGAGHCGSGER